MGPLVQHPGQGLGILGGGYGAAQIAITGAPWFSTGWRGVELLAVLAIVKMVATCFTVGSGGSAGDFGPSLVIGGLVGGAFGLAARLTLHDPRIDPGAFALVGMATFYGGLARVPIASLVMTCELAGSYDLLVPLMLSEGVAFVALRHTGLYPSQVPTRRDSPAHRDEFVADALAGRLVGDVVVRDRPYVTLSARTTAREVAQRAAATAWQDVFPVLDDDGHLIGIIPSEVLRTMAAHDGLGELVLAHDLMLAPVTVLDTDSLRTALDTLLEHGLREVLVTAEDGRIVGFLDEAELSRLYQAGPPLARGAPEKGGSPEEVGRP
jgi:CIC family chloride channel protein